MDRLPVPTQVRQRIEEKLKICREQVEEMEEDLALLNPGLTDAQMEMADELGELEQDQTGK